jgi:beta-mannosidase
MRQNFPFSTGALYWQLNDDWPVISWSSIDYFGRWKALHYMAKRFFNPVLVSGMVKDGKVLVHGSNDFLKDISCDLEWELFSFDGSPVKSDKRKITLRANQDALLDTLDFSGFVNETPELSTYRKESYRNRSNYFLSLRLTKNDSLLSSNVVFFVPPKYWPLNEPGIKYTILKENGKTKINVSAKSFAAWVELGVKDSYARFSDNFFHLLPGETKSVFVENSEVTDRDLTEGFFVKSLIDTYSAIKK